MKIVNNLAIVVIMAVCVALNGGSPATAKTKKQAVDIYDLSIDDNIAMPQLEKQTEEIKKFQYAQAIALQKNKQNVEMTRDGEVIIITISASQLFLPNDTVLSDLGKQTLKPFLKYIETPGMYKMLLVMHHDNTGSDRYTLNLTRSRVNSVYDWIDANANTEYLVPYALGSTEPLVENNSVANRKFNRRLEIYLVPEQAMIQAAKKKNIKL